ncbi:hypothetical protein ACS0TY_031285 [Phlomoides rotata]
MIFHDLMLFSGKASFGEDEWYFFSPRERKYPNGERPNRAATSGYWKATGTDKPVLTANGTQKIGVKKALVFYSGKPPKGIKTNWIMHEYRLLSNNSNTNRPPGINLAKKSSSRLDDWVLCRIFKKNSSITSVETSSSRYGHISQITKPDDRNYFTAEIPGNFISPLASSSLNGMMTTTTNGTIFSGKDWGTDEDNYNPNSSNDKNISFISLLDQQYSQTFNQNSNVNPQETAILHQSYQLPDSHFQNFS